MLIVATLPSQADSGSVRFQITRAGFIVGVGGGNGTLNFRGKTYPLSVGGVSVGMIGASSADLVGRARNLRRASDIAGTYTAVGAGLSIAGGAQTARLRNSNGVVLEVTRPPGRIFGVHRPQRIADIDAVERPRSSRLERESIGSVTFLTPATTCRGGVTDGARIQSGIVCLSSPA